MNFAVSAGNIWKYDATLHKYVQYSTNSSILPNSEIVSYKNIVLVTATNSTNYTAVDTQILIFIDENSALTPVFNYRSFFTTTPTFDYSEMLTKVTATGMKGTVPTVDAYYIDYTKRTNISIVFPMSAIISLSFTEILTFESFIYIRQIYDSSQSSNTSYTSINRQ
jgi:hypothetical protein